ncbi:acyl-CoA dehydrogenase family protein, partial [Acinetobacter baumannii]
ARAVADLAKPRAAELDRTGGIPAEELILLATSGLLGIRVPREFGGLQARYRTVAQVIAILSAASGSLGQIPQNHYHLLEAIFRDGTEEQRRFF